MFAHENSVSRMRAVVETTKIPELEALDPSSGSVIVPSSYSLAFALIAAGGSLAWLGKPAFAVPILLQGSFLLQAALRLRIVFGPSRMSIAKVTAGELEILRGWKYDKFRNWELWWPSLPWMWYFLESESFSGKGSKHLVPMICDAEVLLEQLKIHVKHLDKTNY